MSNTWLEIHQKMTREDLFDNYEDAICELCEKMGIIEALLAENVKVHGVKYHKTILQ